ncbi:MAG: peptide MFS transporter, partial [Flavobacteriaceae bacterium]
MTTETQPEATLLGHPKGLFYLFFAELWERFSFYGMRALLTLYMVNVIFEALATRDIAAAAVYASYGSLVYASTVIGGRISDTLLGFRKSILLGGILMALGHFVLAIENNFMFYLALGLIVVGNGFFKPNISTFVAALYKENDPRKDSGFVIFYMGINIGGFVAPLLCGWLGAAYGWHYGFGLAGIGMLTGLAFFWKGIKAGVF